ncbi:MAG TPA: hypothetical protein VHU81_13485 [Thermoanaerobaculia bacterium]|jgi:hypothetical protein|nr:hypothetical protein [Thermoanaerobaculia bacterium]
MTEPGSVPPVPPAAPFNPTAPGTRPGPGCSKPALIGCGIVLVLIGIGAILFVVKAPQIVAWMFNRLGTDILTRMPADATQEERARLRTAFDDAADAVQSGKADQTQLQNLQAKMLQIAGKPQGQTLTRDEVRELTEALEALAGKSVAEGGGAGAG